MEQHPDKVLQQRLNEFLKNQKERTESLENIETNKRTTSLSPEKNLTEYERSQQ